MQGPGPGQLVVSDPAVQFSALARVQQPVTRDLEVHQMHSLHLSSLPAAELLQLLPGLCK